MTQRVLAYQAKKEARKRGIPFSDFLIEVLTKEVGHVKLSARDYEEIAKATKRAEMTRKRISTPLAD